MHGILTKLKTHFQVTRKLQYDVVVATCKLCKKKLLNSQNVKFQFSWNSENNGYETTYIPTSFWLRVLELFFTFDIRDLAEFCEHYAFQNWHEIISCGIMRHTVYRLS